MLVTILGGLVGLFTGIAPDILGLIRDWNDKKQEVKLLEIQERMAKAGHGYRMAEIDATADISEMQTLRRSPEALGPAFLQYADGKVYPWILSWITLGYGLIDILNGSVRPVMAYYFVGLYGMMKSAMMLKAAKETTQWAEAMAMVWDENDMAIVLAVVMYYFGQRAMKYARESLKTV